MYATLLMRWNDRLNLSAIRSEVEVINRHLAEGIEAAGYVLGGSLLDFGSGAGLPGIPIAVCRPEIAVTLAESNQKKAAFLREVDRVLHCGYRVHAGRVEDLPSDVKFATVTMRAVDRMEKMAPIAAQRVSPGGELMLFTTAGQVEGLRSAVMEDFVWRSVAGSSGESRVLLIGLKPE